MERQGKNAGPALKICGLTRTEDLEVCLRLGVEYVGFNLYQHSKRFINAKAARQLWLASEPLRRTDQPGAITKAVAVVVDATAANISSLLREFPELSVVQCHGRENPTEMAAIKSVMAGRELWKAISVVSAADIDAARCFDAADLILFDAKSMSSDPALKGGTGLNFDWQLLTGLALQQPWGLAGGVGADVVSLALALKPAPTLLDACSRLEVAPGLKDAVQIEKLVQAMGNS